MIFQVSHEGTRNVTSFNAHLPIAHKTFFSANINTSPFFWSLSDFLERPRSIFVSISSQAFSTRAQYIEEESQPRFNCSLATEQRWAESTVWNNHSREEEGGRNLEYFSSLSSTPSPPRWPVYSTSFSRKRKRLSSSFFLFHSFRLPPPPVFSLPQFFPLWYSPPPSFLLPLSESYKLKSVWMKSNSINFFVGCCYIQKLKISESISLSSVLCSESPSIGCQLTLIFPLSIMCVVQLKTLFSIFFIVLLLICASTASPIFIEEEDAIQPVQHLHRVSDALIFLFTCSLLSLHSVDSHNYSFNFPKFWWRSWLSMNNVV